MTALIRQIASVPGRLRGMRRARQYRQMQKTPRFDPAEALILTSDPRGGSTWLSELLGHLPRTETLWEPLHIRHVPAFAGAGFRMRHHIAEDDPAPEAKALFDQLFSGQMLSPYLCCATSPGALAGADRLLVKFCRANQLLPWLTAQYDFACRPVHMVRHPCAVAASQMKYGAWDKAAGRPGFSDGELQSDPLLAPHADILERIETIEERLAAFWCLTNGPALTHPGCGTRWLSLTYEDLVLSPEAELRRIEAAWGMTFPEAVFAATRQSSKTTLKGSPIAGGDAMGQLGYWQSRLEPEQVRRILDMLAAFGIDLYSEAAQPRR